MKKIEDIKLGEAFRESRWILIARKQTLDNKDWYIVLALDPETNVYSVSRMMDVQDVLFGKYSPDFMEAIKWFLDHFDMSARKKKGK